MHYLRLAAISLLLLAGCENAKHNMEKNAANDAFLAEDEARSYRKFAIAQEAAGARHDGMLYDYHFDGSRLNSLGERKLSVMLRDNDHAFPVVIYLNSTDEPRAKARREAVATYMMDCGLESAQVRFEAGPNPNAVSSGAQNLSRLSKTESESPVASNPTNPGSPGAGTGGGGGGADTAGK
jgi:hypothetical protein